MDDLIADFITETREGLEALDSELVRFEQTPDDPDTLSGVFRLIHTIKGTCGFLGLSRLQKVAHHAESVLGGFRDGLVPVSPAAVSAVLEAVDLIRTLTEGLAAGGGEPEGEDGDLIARLDSIYEQSAAAEEASPPPRPAAGGSLIDRMGGDAMLDAAVEMALPGIIANPGPGPALAAVDPDRLQGALRDALVELVRKQAPTGALHTALRTLGFDLADGAAAAAVIESVALALSDLEVEDACIDELRRLAHPPAAAPAPEPLFDVPEAPAVPAKAPLSVSPAAAEGAAQTIRVSVDALEHLMTVVSELVLIRNQLIQALRLEPESPFAAPLHRLNQVTSELQEGVMTTRMQPISGAWAKLPRLVRDLAQELGKSIDLVMSGQETELDRQVLELIKDPLTHMIRNAADHGLETPEERRAAGKRPTGRITLHARHEGGAILIDVADDGRGLSAEKIRAKAQANGLITGVQAEQMSEAEARQLIFLPGFSTAAQVTSVSGRGVGMDVVRTNIEKIGGTIEVSSAEGAGTRFVIRIPLTLTIVSALIVECCGERFALPQSALVELVSASGASGHAIEQIEGASVLRLRDRLLPLVSLQQLLQLEPAGEPSGETCIVVARVGPFTFGVIVDRVFDTEEIVVKPVASVLRHLKLYSGATILGDGSVILILDPKGVSVEAGAGQGGGVAEGVEERSIQEFGDREALLVFRAANGALKATPLASVSRIEEVEARELERVDGRTVIQYRGRLMPILGVDARPAEAWDGAVRRPLLVFARESQAVGLLVEEIVDIVERAVSFDLQSGGEGVLGSLIIADRATELIDVAYYWDRAVNDSRGGPQAAAPGAAAPASTHRLLVIDPSPFSRLLLQPLLLQAGYEVTILSSAAAAMERYKAGDRFDLILADTRTGRPETHTFAKVMSEATAWGDTPLVSIVLSGPAGDAPPPIETTTLLATVEAALDPLRGAA